MGDAMDFIKNMINENSGAFTESLSGAGFSVDQAKGFLPEVVSSISNACDKDGIGNVVSGITSGDSSQLLDSINVGDIASKLGMSSEQVSSGFESIMPALKNLISANGGGLTSMISAVTGGSGSDLLGKVKSLFN